MYNSQILLFSAIDLLDFSMHYINNFWLGDHRMTLPPQPHRFSLEHCTALGFVTHKRGMHDRQTLIVHLTCKQTKRGPLYRLLPTRVYHYQIIKHMLCSAIP